ncbi:MAG: YceG family protein [Eubacteriales bacterium]|nr:YceG family protein [Eubacteriales bacterium]
MLEHKKIQNLSDFFTELGKRREKGVYFYRINGYSEEIGKFLYDYYDAARKSGVIIEGKIPNPTEGNLAYYYEMMGNDFQLSMGFIMSSLKKWLPRMNRSQNENVAASIYDSLEELRRSGKTENMLRNAYIKFMCWLYYKFERIVNQLGMECLPKILYVGSISNYELLLISVLSNAGCDVVLVQPSGDEAYLKLDPYSLRSDRYGSEKLREIPSDFSLRKLREDIEKAAQNQKIFGSGNGFINCTNAWIEGSGLTDILKKPEARGDREDFFYNCYLRINGVEDKLTYANELYQFYLELRNQKRPTVIVNGSIPNPTTDEIMKIRRTNYTGAGQMIADLEKNIQYPASSVLQAVFCRAFEEVMKQEANEPGISLNRLMNKGVYLLCWIKRYQDQLFKNWKKKDISCFIHMGVCQNINEVLFMKFLARVPSDVLILNPDRNEQIILEDSLLYEINYDTSMVLKRFPEQNAQLHIGTAAYHAERELDTLMYNDSVIFRDQQFAQANTISLQTMDREIKLLWNTEIKYRPNFSTVDGVVNLPVIFSKISGVKDQKTEDYWISIKQLMTPETVVIDHPPFFTSTSPNPIKMYAAEFFKNGKLQRRKIKTHPAYPYGFLREEMQDYILDKLETMIEQRLIRGTFENGTEYTIISVALNLPKQVTRLIQNFDFTKKNPKMIYINTSEVLITLEDSIYTAFLNLLGFDVLFFIPTGYNMDNHFNQKLMEEHQAGNYMYDLQIPDWNTISLTVRTSWRDRIFRKG